MKEKDIWLSREELQQLLQGSLQWVDVESHRTMSRTGIRKTARPISEERLVPEQIWIDQSRGKKGNIKRLEGQPVIWLLGSVGLLTLSSWFYFVIFSK
jgi:hypothetical protein